MLDRKSEPGRRKKSGDAPERKSSSPKKKSVRSFSQRQPETQFEIVRGLASPVRVRILRLLRRRGPLNVNQISEALGMPQSTIATNIQILEESDLIDTETGRARKGQQKICAARFDEIVIRLDGEETTAKRISSKSRCRRALHQLPCVGTVRHLFDRGDHGCARRARLVSRSRPGAGRADLVGRGYVEYKFPNNAKVLDVSVTALEFALELSSKCPAPMPTGPRHLSLGQRRQNRHLDLAGRLRRPPRRSYPAMVETRGIAIRRADAVAYLLKGTFMGAKKLSSVTLAQLRLPETSPDPAADRDRRQRGPSRWRQYFRPRLWQSQPRYPDAAALEVGVGAVAGASIARRFRIYGVSASLGDATRAFIASLMGNIRLAFRRNRRLEPFE